jgi:hypothetical protein
MSVLRELSEDLRVGIKDRLREVRRAIRGRRDDRASGSSIPAPFPIREIEGFLGHAASAFDDALSFAETLVPITRGTTATRGFADYFPAATADHMAGERLFRRDAYYMTKAVAKALKLGEVRLSEAEFASVHGMVRRRHGAVIAEPFGVADWNQRVTRAAAATAAVLLEMLHHRPVRLAPAATPADDRATEIGCLAPVALTMGIATVGAEGLSTGELLETSVLAVEARIDRILAAAASREPQAELTATFATLLAHLP